MKVVDASLHVVPDRVIARIWDRVQVGGPDECWNWTGQVGWSVGSGKNAGTTSHRVTWLAVNGAIPGGMTVDHTCRNRPCCNPMHLRLLSNVQNATDNGQGRKTHCPRGHEYAGSNLYVDPKGHRRCRACVPLRGKKRRDSRHSRVSAR